MYALTLLGFSRCFIYDLPEDGLGVFIFIPPPVVDVVVSLASFFLFIKSVKHQSRFDSGDAKDSKPLLWAYELSL